MGDDVVFLGEDLESEFVREVGGFGRHVRGECYSCCLVMWREWDCLDKDKYCVWGCCGRSKYYISVPITGRYLH